MSKATKQRRPIPDSVLYGSRDPKEIARRKRRFSEMDMWMTMPEAIREKLVGGLLGDKVNAASRVSKIIGEAADWSTKTVGGRKTTIVHRMGDTYERQVTDPITRKAVTISTARERRGVGSGGAVVTSVFGSSPDGVDPFNVAKVFGISFASPFDREVPSSMSSSDAAAYNEYRKSLGLPGVPSLGSAGAVPVSTSPVQESKTTAKGKPKQSDPEPEPKPKDPNNPIPDPANIPRRDMLYPLRERGVRDAVSESTDRTGEISASVTAHAGGYLDPKDPRNDARLEAADRLYAREHGLVYTGGSREDMDAELRRKRKGGMA